MKTTSGPNIHPRRHGGDISKGKEPTATFPAPTHRLATQAHYAQAGAGCLRRLQLSAAMGTAVPQVKAIPEEPHDTVEKHPGVRTHHGTLWPAKTLGTSHVTF